MRNDERTGHTQPRAGGGQTESSPQHHLEDIALLRSQREANGDLTPLFIHHVGNSSIDAKPGEQQGSEFKVRLPLAEPDSGDLPSPPAASEDNPSPTSDRRILIVDDNVDAAETLRMLIRSLGERQVYTASSGSQALDTATEVRPDIVLLDLAMPEMDCYEVARRIRRQPWGKQLLLVALSGWSHEDHRRRTKEAGFDRHVSKPADMAALRAVLREARPAI